MFVDVLKKFNDKTAIITTKGINLSYEDLAEKVDNFAFKLGKKRRLLIVEATNEIEPLIAYLGALRARHPVILTETGDANNDRGVIETFNPYGVYNKDSSLVWSFSLNPQYQETPLHEELCILLSTSGTTGSSKLVRLSRKNIEENAKSIVQYLNLDSEQKVITTLPFHYSFGMSIVNSHLASGGTLLLTDDSVSSPNFWEFFRYTGGTSFSAVPYTFELLERIGFRDENYPALQYIAQAGGRLSVDLVQQYSQWAKASAKRIYVMYGQTEASPRMAYVPPEQLADNSDCIGIPIPGGHLHLIDSHGHEITGIEQPGELIYQGPNVMMGYAQSQQDLVKGQESDILHTGDLACRNEAGLYRIVGRISRFSKILGLRIGLDELEVFLQDIGFPTVVVGNDQKIVIATLQHGASEKILKSLASKYKLAANVFSILELNEYPLLSSGKIDNRGLLELSEPLDDSPQNYKTLLHAFSDIMGNVDIRESDSFLNLGGDSIFYVMISIAIENHLGYLPDNWEAMSVGDLDKLNSIKEKDISANISVKKAWLALCLIIGFLMIGELFLQLRSYIKTGRSAFALVGNNSTTVHNTELGIKTYRPNLLIKGTVNQSAKMAINSYGLRSPELNLKTKPDEIRIAIVGASTVAGAYAESYDRTFPQLLARNLRDKYGEKRLINVINGGIEGHTISDSIKLTEGLIFPMNPSVIVIYPGFNDITSLCKINTKVQHTYQGIDYPKLPNWLMTKDMIRKNSVFLRTLEKQNIKGTDKVNPDTIDPFPYTQKITALIQSIQAQGITPVLMTVARAFQNMPREKQIELATTALYYYECLDLDGIIKVSEIYNNQIRLVAKQYDILLVDIAKTMPGGNKYFVDTAHFTYEGEKHVVQTLKNTLFIGN